MTTNKDFSHKRELLLAKFQLVRELSILTKSMLEGQLFEGATALSVRLDAATEQFEEGLASLEAFDYVEEVQEQNVLPPDNLNVFVPPQEPAPVFEETPAPVV